MADVKTTREDREAAAAALMNPVLVPRSTVDAWVDTGFEDFNGWEAMAREYRDVAAAIAKARAEGAAAALDAVLPLEKVGGRWGLSGEGDPTAVATYASEPSPETGHVGWVWWANGKMGEAKSLKEAMAAADASEARRG